LAVFEFQNLHFPNCFGPLVAKTPLETVGAISHVGALAGNKF